LGYLAICFGNEESLVKPIHVLYVFHDAVEQLFIFPPLLWALSRDKKPQNKYELLRVDCRIAEAVIKSWESFRGEFDCTVLYEVTQQFEIDILEGAHLFDYGMSEFLARFILNVSLLTVHFDQGVQLPILALK
jgi:hypothetical protein